MEASGCLRNQEKFICLLRFLTPVAGAKHNIRSYFEGNMRKIAVILFIVLFPLKSLAALPPEYQNEKDFDVIIEFIKSHEKVISTFKSIDFKKFIVYFDDDCEAIFGRKVIQRPSGWVGPAAPLELKSTTCNLESQ